MTRSSYWLWLSIALILLLPSAAGRFILDLAGGVLITLLALPLILAGGGWLGWKFLQSKMTTCKACGISSMSNSNTCPICGTNKSGENNNSNELIDASNATIDIQAESIDKVN